MRDGGEVVRLQVVPVVVGVVVLALVLGLAGCSQADAVKSAKAIVSYMPVVRALVTDSAALAVALDADSAAMVEKVSATVVGDLKLVEEAAAGYVAAPTTTGWSALVKAMDGLVADADASVLTAAGIKSSESQRKARAALAAVDAAVHVLDAYMQSAQGKAEAKASLERRNVRVEEVARYWSSQDWRRVEVALGW